MFDSYFEVLANRIEENGKQKAEIVKKATERLINADGFMEMFGLLDNFDKDELISIVCILANKIKDMKKDMERLEDDGK